MKKTYQTLAILIATLGSASISAQVWSPDGSQIAFFYIHTIEDLYVVDSDGSNFKIVDQHPERDFSPGWSPDGKKILFTSVRDKNHELYELTLKTNSIRRVTETAFDSEDGHYSPDGKRIVFTSNRSGENEVYIMNRKSGKIEQITKTPDVESTAKWSPDGTRILFRKAPTRKDPADLYTMNADGTDIKQITKSFASEFHQSWSWDGSKICYIVVVDGVFEIHTMNSDGSNDKVLVRKEGYQSFFPNWSPDGEWIAFTRDVSEGTKDGYPALFKVDLEGNERLISNDNSFHLYEE